ncbi:MAG: hypothetical protein M3096_09190 [Actinomycetia bacterium]|nr:hypothetical protein [Actinomycetes bacterium]
MRSPDDGGLSAFIERDAGELDRAEGLNRAAARSDLETGAAVNTGLALLQAATFAGLRGRAERAATLFGAGDTHFAMQKAPFQDRIAQPAIDSATEALGPTDTGSSTSKATT